MILVGGVVVAFALVALVLLLNSALFTENISTRGIDPGIERAGDHVTVSRQGGGGVVSGLENVEYTTWSDARNAVKDNISNISSQVRRIHLERYGSYVSVNVSNARRGTVVVQDNITRNFSSATGQEQWNLTNTSGIRNFTMTVNKSRTESVPRNQTFNLTVIGGNGKNWSAFVNASVSGVNLAVPSSNTFCTSAASNATVNWTDGTFDGSCSFTFAAGLDPPYEIKFNNSDNATGTYHFVVSNTSSNVFTGNFNGPGSGRSPRQYPGTYSLMLEILYEDSSTEYNTTVRVAPDEPTETSPT